MSASAAQELKNVYTDAPALHPHPLLASLQLVFWLFFHPSAWRNHVARVDPGLRPDFCLAELSQAQWQNPALRRSLMLGCGLWPALALLLTGLTLWALGESGPSVVTSVAFTLAVSAMFSVAIGVAYGLATVAAALLAGVVAFVAADFMAVGLARVEQLLLARREDVEAAVPSALSHGRFFFADIARNQVDAHGLAVLRFLAAQGEGGGVRRETLARRFGEGLDRALDLLVRRELIEAEGAGFRFQVALIRRWFVQDNK